MLNNLIFSVSPYQFSFQTPASPSAQGIMNFHHDLFFFLFIIIGFVFYVMFWAIYLWDNEDSPEKIDSRDIAMNKKSVIFSFSHASVLEIIWTLIPAFILSLIAFPSFTLMYSMDEIINAFLTFKVVGHQWYWSYETISPELILSQFLNENFEDKTDIISFDSYMATNDMLQHISQRSLDVDNKLYVAVITHIRFLITSADVLHSWAIPALGVKLDACPGRLNQTSIFINRPGTFHGQCSEICGVNHGFMPIAVTALDLMGESFSAISDDFDFLQLLFGYIEALQHS